MNTTTRLCDIESLVPALSSMLAPIISTSERVLVCVENTYSTGHGTALAAIVLTPQYLYYAFQDLQPDALVKVAPSSQELSGMRERIALQDISAIERRITQAGYHQLVIYDPSGSRFVSCEFSSEYIIDMFIKALSQVGLSVKNV